MGLVLSVDNFLPPSTSKDKHVAFHRPYFNVKLHMDAIGFVPSMSAMLPTMGRPGGPGIVSYSITEELSKKSRLLGKVNELLKWWLCKKHASLT